MESYTELVDHLAVQIRDFPAVVAHTLEEGNSYGVIRRVAVKSDRSKISTSTRSVL